MKRKMINLFLILGLLLCLMPLAAAPVKAETDTFFGVLISDTEGNMSTGGSYWMYYPGLENEGQRTGPTNNFVNEGEEVVLLADPDSGYRFVGWFQGEPDPQDGELRYNGDPLETDREYRFIAPIGLTRPYICAVFQEDSNVHYGDQVQMWVGNTDGRAGDSTVMGGKVAVKYTPSWNDWPDEIVARDGTDFVYGEILQFYKGDECTVYAEPDEGYNFVGWYHVNIEWGPGGGKSYEGDVISTEKSFTYKPGVTIVPGDEEPLRYVCAVFEEKEEGTCTVSFAPGTGKGSMAPVTVNAGEEYELPACTFAHDNSERVFYRWSVNDELFKAGESITVTEDTTVTAKWHYTRDLKIDNSVDRSVTNVMGGVYVNDKRLNNNSYTLAFDETTSSAFTEPRNVTVTQMIKEAKEACLAEAENWSGGIPVTVVSETVSDPQINQTNDSRTFTYFDNAVDQAGDYYRYLIIDGEYLHYWRITLTIKTEFKGLFTDVKDSKHPYFTAIYWAADNGITRGYSNGAFGINDPCTRGHAVQFLWNMAKRPEPEASDNAPFPDVPKGHSYYRAVLWAQQQGITKGYTQGVNKGKFGVNDPCTRGQIMSFIWRYKKQPAPEAVSKTPFPDVPATHPYYKAILWGSQKGVTKGYTTGPKKGQFGINDTCTRGQIVKFLHSIR